MQRLNKEEAFEKNNLLESSIDKMELSVRSHNCLEAAGINSIGDLVQKNELELLAYKNFGRKCLKEINDKFKEMDLEFGMNIDQPFYTSVPLEIPDIEKIYSFFKLPDLFNSVPLEKLKLLHGREMMSSKNYNAFTNKFETIGELKNAYLKVPQSYRRQCGVEHNEFTTYSDLLFFKGIGRTKVDELDMLVYHYHKDFETLIDYLEIAQKMGKFNEFNQLSCSYNLCEFFKKHNIKTLEDLGLFVFSDSVDLHGAMQEILPTGDFGINRLYEDRVIITESDILALLELLTTRVDKNSYEISTSATFKSKKLIFFDEAVDFYLDKIIKNLDIKTMIFDRFEDNLSLDEIGQKHGLTRERVRQILEKLYNSNRFDNYFLCDYQDGLNIFTRFILDNKKPIDISFFSKRYKRKYSDEFYLRFLSFFFPEIPFFGVLSNPGSTTYKKAFKYLNSLPPFSMMIDELISLENGHEYLFPLFAGMNFTKERAYLENLNLPEDDPMNEKIKNEQIFFLDEDGFIYKKLSKQDILAFITDNITRPITTEEYCSIILSNEFFDNLAKKGVTPKDVYNILGRIALMFDYHTYGNESHFVYKEEDDWRKIQDIAINLIKEIDHELSAHELIKVVNKEFPKLTSKYELVLILRNSEDLEYIHPFRFKLPKMKTQNTAANVAYNILKNSKYPMHGNELYNEIVKVRSFRPEGINTLARQSNNLVFYGANYFGAIDNKKRDKKYLSNDHMYIQGIMKINQIWVNPIELMDKVGAKYRNALDVKIFIDMLLTKPDIHRIVVGNKSHKFNKKYFHANKSVVDEINNFVKEKKETSSVEYKEIKKFFRKFYCIHIDIDITRFVVQILSAYNRWLSFNEILNILIFEFSFDTKKSHGSHYIQKPDYYARSSANRSIKIDKLIDNLLTHEEIITSFEVEKGTIDIDTIDEDLKFKYNGLSDKVLVVGDER